MKKTTLFALMFMSFFATLSFAQGHGNQIACQAPTVVIQTPSPACQNATVLLTATTSTVQVDDFVENYAIANWSLSNTNADGSVNTTGAPASIALTSGNNGSNASGDTNYTITVATTGTISFSWSYSTDDGPDFDYPSVIVNGVPTLFTGYNQSGASNQSGSMTVNVIAGQSFAFNMHTLDNTFGPATVVISNFAATKKPNLNWVATNGGTIIGANNQLSVNVTTSGTYTLTATIGSCSSSDSEDFTFTPNTTNGSVTQAQCGGTYTWPLPFGNGQTYSSSQNLTNNVGCNTATLNLTITPITNLGSVTTSVQGAYTWPLPYGTGQTYTTNQTGLTKTTGCNIATLNLTIIVPVTTFTVGQSCSATINNLAVTINTPPVTGAVSYTFRLRNMATLAPAQTIVRPVNSFALSNFPGTTLGTPYQVEVAVNSGPFGLPCLLNTPAPFCNIDTQCGTTLTSMGQWVNATYIPNITGYRFRITNTVTTGVQIFDTASNRFNFSQLANRDFGTVYFVEVALKNVDNTYLQYSSGCNITTQAFPTTALLSSHCGQTATSNTQNFSATIVSGATDYRFTLTRFSPGPPYTATKDRAGVNTFNLSMFPGIPTGGYLVSVAVRIGGVWGPYGSTCYIATPGYVQGPGDGTKTNASNFKAIAYPNPFAADFKLDVTTTAINAIQIIVYDMLGRQVENRNVEANDINNVQLGADYPSGVYNVIVSQGEQKQTVRVIKR